MEDNEYEEVLHILITEMASFICYNHDDLFKDKFSVISYFMDKNGLTGLNNKESK